MSAITITQNYMAKLSIPRWRVQAVSENGKVVHAVEKWSLDDATNSVRRWCREQKLEVTDTIFRG